MLDCLNANKIYYFELLLKEKGFLLEVFNENNIIDNVDLDIDLNDNINKVLYDEYIKSTDKNIVKFENLNKRINFLNLTTDKLDLYKEIIYDDHKFEEHINIIRFQKSDKYINTKLNELKQNSFTMKYMTDPYNKIYLLRSLMNKYKIEYFNIKYEKPDLTEIVMEDDLWNHYKKIFRISKEKPKNHYELIIMIVGMIKHITCSNMITNTRFNFNKIKYLYYEFDNKFIKYHLVLNSYANNDDFYFHQYVTNLLDINNNIFYD